MTDARPGTAPGQARSVRSRRRVGSAVVANYIHEISTRHAATQAARAARTRIVDAPITRPLAAEGCA
jgi:hypothetical protein